MSPEAPASLLKRMYPHRFTILLVILVVNLMLAPVLAIVTGARNPALDGALSLAAFAFLLVSAVYAVSRSRSIALWALALAAAAVLAAGIEFTTGSRAALLAHHVLDGLLLLFFTGLLLRYIFTRRRVTLDLISAALCAYLILGLMCASGFAVIETVRPGSFHVPDDGMGPFVTAGYDVEETARRVYFSYVTLLTLGYGDLFPTGSMARIFAVMEAFAGQIMMVVLVARLVGVHVAQSFEAPDPPDPTGEC